MKVQLAEINKDLDELSAKIEKSSDAVKAEATPKLNALREQAAKLNGQLAEATKCHRDHLGQREGDHQEGV